MRRRPELDVHAWELWEELALPSGVADQQESEEFISGFLDRLAGVATKVRVLSEEHSVRIGLVYWAKQMPYVGLTSRQVESVAGLGAGLDYDFFLDLDDEEAHTS
jgi:hypothetical protein